MMSNMLAGVLTGNMLTKSMMMSDMLTGNMLAGNMLTESMMMSNMLTGNVPIIGDMMLGWSDASS